ncbi:LysR family transcriptional regulator [Stenotrophomonas sp. ZAC14D1_NAIMI4_6]|uniref:LysR family transcriptional regulator n=1 Tax=unclassified Stenotrophomonas maltophilia group TaxID=2961925 RepID=UPI000D542336|nr:MULTISPECIES: LysR family transcriptional regulator [unclassified Stenotrophomonas maltophilia group]AWH37443.1 LysR family transcriptional regulator [Stenotrophomonas sp. ZAC14D1_NAIMI4_6]AWH41633.1 LysR family transcriptional regulator [Stenotrophomonas sp. ZAC14D1_NAIMI4_1]
MPYSPESLQAFVEAAALGSFSAAARRLRKTQSTVSTAIAHLEADLGVALFDRSARYPQLTEAGREVLGHAQEILAADQRLQQLSVRLAAPVEPRLTVVFSDVYQLDPAQRVLQRFAEAFPEVELEWLDAEGHDVLEIVTSARADLGLLPRQDRYPDALLAQPLAHHSELAIYVALEHPLARAGTRASQQLARHRQVRLSAQADHARAAAGRVWTASDYLMVMEMAEDGIGWAELPRALVQRYDRGRLLELRLPGWPRRIHSDLVRRRDSPPGPAALWWADALG